MTALLIALTISTIIGTIGLIMIMIIGYDAWISAYPWIIPKTILAVTSGSLVFSTSWALCFKYWQTAYELDFLFRIDCD